METQDCDSDWASSSSASCLCFPGATDCACRTRAVRVRTPVGRRAMSMASQTSAQSARRRDVPARRVANNERASTFHVREGSTSNSLVQGTRASRDPFPVDRDRGTPGDRTTAATSVSSRDSDKGRTRNSLREGVSSSECFRRDWAGKNIHEVLITLQRLRNELRNRDCSQALAMWGPVYAPRDPPPGGRPLSMSWRAMQERHAMYRRQQNGEITSYEVSQHPFLSLAPVTRQLNRTQVYCQGPSNLPLNVAVHDASHTHKGRPPKRTDGHCGI